MRKYVDFDVLKGLTLKDVTQHGREDIIFTTTEGRQFRMYYEQDCCADCHIEDVNGDLSDLVNAEIVQAEEVTSREHPPDVKASEYDNESYTWTFYKLATRKGYVTIRWYGSSNGYYSETATFVEME